MEAGYLWAWWWPSPWALGMLLLWDALLGEPPAVLHPVVWMGRVIQPVLHHDWGGADVHPRRAFAWGLALAVGVPLGFFLLAAASLVGLAWVVRHGIGDSSHLWASVLLVAVQAYWLKSTAALHGLGRAARELAGHLAAGRLVQAQASLGALCSRDPQNLSPTQLAQGGTESVAENLGDAWVAPLCYALLLGVPGAVAYRAVNTLDAMVGYRGPLEYLGKASARLDDASNYVPARLSAVLLLLGGGLLGKNAAQGWYVWWRDAGRTASPNAGHPMAAMAGLLGVCLEKPKENPPTGHPGSEGYVLGAGLPNPQDPAQVLGEVLGQDLAQDRGEELYQGLAQVLGEDLGQELAQDRGQELSQALRQGLGEAFPQRGGGFPR